MEPALPRPESLPRLGYRAEIDGLRAIAVLAVVLFHARLGVLTGGYAGVDVFFVISGFLISRLIAEEVARSGRFSVLGFYERRIRRLLPALGVMVALVLAVGWHELPPLELTALTRSAFAALAFFSNLHFARQAGYFQADAETQPLLHTWSLGVEEQFYILAPFVFVGLLRLSRHWQRLGLGVLFLISLGFAVAGAWQQREASFFWPQGRAHELLIGAALGLRLVPLPSSALVRWSIAVLGLALVALALLFLPKGIYFPGAYALLPCVGTALVIAASEGGPIPGLAGRLLCARPMRFFGAISYSLYLWHWPVLVFAELRAGQALSPLLALACIALAVALAWLSYRFIESPARHGVVSRRWAVVFLPALVLILAGFGVQRLSVARAGFPDRFGPEMRAMMASLTDPKRAPPQCEGGRCRLGVPDAPISFVFWGDSHARVMAPELGDIARERGQAGLLLIRDGCPPLLDATGASLTPTRKCRAVSDELNALLATTPGLKVIIAARWALYAEASGFGEESGVEARPLVQGGLEANRRAFAAALAQTQTYLRGKGASLRLIGPVPEQGRNIQAALARQIMGKKSDDLFVARARFEARQSSVLPALAAAQGQGARVFLPHEALCTPLGCQASAGARALYVDDDHLSAAGAARLRDMLGLALDR